MAIAAEIGKAIFRIFFVVTCTLKSGFAAVPAMSRKTKRTAYTAAIIFSIIAANTMAQKHYSLYNSETIEGDQQLAVEIGKSYIVLILGTATRVAGLEYYEIADSELEEMLEYIKQHSQILDTNYSEARLYYNLRESVLVPVGQFNTSVAAELIDLAFGPSVAARINVENVNVQPGIVNVYRSHEDWQPVITQYFRAVTKRHLISKLLERTTADGLKVQFYKNEMVVIATNNMQLQLARNFERTTEADAVYHILNSCKQTAIDPLITTIELSGFIDDTSEIVQLLSKYFASVKFQHPVEGVLPQGQLLKYPLHYFTPFFNLLS